MELEQQNSPTVQLLKLFNIFLFQITIMWYKMSRTDICGWCKNSFLLGDLKFMKANGLYICLDCDTIEQLSIGGGPLFGSHEMNFS